MTISIEPGGETPEDYPERVGSSYTALFEQRDPKHQYYLEQFGISSEYCDRFRIKRRGRIPVILGGKIFDRVVAKVWHNSSIICSRPVCATVYGTNPLVSSDELEEAGLRGLESLERALMREVGLTHP